MPTTLRTAVTSTPKAGAPTGADDADAGYGQGSVILDSVAGTAYTCISVAVPGGAVWKSGGGPATQITITGDPTPLTIGAVADGQFLKRVGTTLIGATMVVALGVTTASGAMANDGAMVAIVGLFTDGGTIV